MSRLFSLQKSCNFISRNASTLQRNPVSKKGFLMGGRSSVNAQRNMSGHGPDISKLEAALYIFVGGGGFAAFGMYQTKKMRERIEAFDTGKILPFKSLSDEEFQVFRQKFRELHSEEEEEEEGESSQEEQEPEEPSAQDEVDVDSLSQEEDDMSIPRRIAKSSKDTVIFVEAPKE